MLCGYHRITKFSIRKGLRDQLLFLQNSPGFLMCKSKALGICPEEWPTSALLAQGSLPTKVTIREVIGTLLAILLAKRAASLGHFYNWLFISPEILSVFMLLVTKQKLIFHQLGRVSFLKNESLCLLARQFYPEAQWLQNGKENYGPWHARPYQENQNPE